MRVSFPCAWRPPSGVMRCPLCRWWVIYEEMGAHLVEFHAPRRM